ncbi:MAG: hypothetical protein ACI37Q_03420 [Candidatus Gastranaerophilaceae bacterium]
MSLTTNCSKYVITKLTPLIAEETKTGVKTAKSIFSSANQVASATANETAEHITRHGLEEIVVESRRLEGGGFITHDGGRISHPAQPEIPKGPYARACGRYFPYSNYDGPNGCAVRHEIIPQPNGDTWVKFYDSTDTWVGRIEKIKYEGAQRINPKDMAQLPRRASTPTEVKPLPEITEPHFQHFKSPKGTTGCARIYNANGTSTITFHDSNGNALRSIICDKDGYPIKYTDYTKKYINRSTGEISDTPIKSGEAYDEVLESSTYEINDTKVVATTQTKEIIPHDELGLRGKSYKTTVTRRGEFEEVTIDNGDKKINEFFFTSSANHKGRLVANGARNLSREEIAAIQSDPYLSSRYYNDGVDFVNSSKPIVYKQEGIRNAEETPITFNTPKRKNNLGVYTPNPRGYRNERIGGNINMTPSHVEKSPKKEVIATLAHETGHGRQYDIMEDNLAGKLTGEEKAFADELQYANDHYVQPEVNFQEYWNNKMEVDARRAGKEAKDIFENNEETQRKIFTA